MPGEHPPDAWRRKPRAPRLADWIAVDRPVRVAVLGEGLAARRYAAAAATVDDVELSPARDAQALILVDDKAPPVSEVIAEASTAVPVLIDPVVLVSLGADQDSRSALRALRSPVLAALPWRSSPVVRLARKLLAAPRFVHAHVTAPFHDLVPAAAFHTLDILTHLMGQPPHRVYAESGGGASTEPASLSALAGTLEFGARGSAAFVVSRLDSPSARLSAVVQLTDGQRRVTLAEGFSTATLTGFSDAAIGAARVPPTRRRSGRSEVVAVDWRPAQGLVDAVSGLVQTVRTGRPPPEAPNLAGALRTAALVRAALAASRSGRARRLVTREETIA